MTRKYNFITLTYLLLTCYNCTNTRSERLSPEQDTPTQSVIAELTFEYHEKDGKLYFEGATNLPEGTKIGITVSNELGFYAQDFDILVKDNRYTSTGFTNQGKQLVGNYKAELNCYFNTSWHDEDILKQLEPYEGKLIQVEESEIFGEQRVISISKEISLRY